MAANWGAWDALLMIHCCWICYLSIRLLVRLLRQRREIITYCIRFWLSRAVANKYLLFSQSFNLPYATKRLVHFRFLKFLVSVSWLGRLSRVIRDTFCSSLRDWNKLQYRSDSLKPYETSLLLYLQCLWRSDLQKNCSSL